MAKIRISKHQEKTLALLAAGGEMQTDFGGKLKKTVILLDGKEIPVSSQSLDAMIDRGLIEKRVDQLPIRFWKMTARGRKCVPAKDDP